MCQFASWETAIIGAPHTHALVRGAATLVIYSGYVHTVVLESSGIVQADYYVSGAVHIGSQIDETENGALNTSATSALGLANMHADSATYYKLVYAMLDARDLPTSSIYVMMCMCMLCACSSRNTGRELGVLVTFPHSNKPAIKGCSVEEFTVCSLLGLLRYACYPNNLVM